MSVATSPPRRSRRRRVDVRVRDLRPRVIPTRSATEVVASLAEVMDELVALVSRGNDGLTGSTGVGAGDIAVALAGERRRLEAALAGVVGVHASGSEWAAEGFANPKAWLRAHTGDGSAAAGRLVAQSHASVTCPVMAEAWADGQVSWSHVAVLADAHRAFPQLRPGLSAMEGELAYAAAGVEPEEFGRILFEHLHALDPDALDEADAAKRRDRVGLHVSRTFDGYVRLDGLLPPELGESLLTALAAAREATRLADCDPSAPKLADPKISGSAPTFSQRNMAALAHIVAAAASVNGPDGLPSVQGQRPVVHITIPTESLTCERGAHSTLPGWIENFTGQPVTPITAEAARRISCDATTRLLTLDPRGCIDSISAKVRTIPTALRRYVLTRDGGQCRFPNCHSPIHEIHHVIHWAHGGTTTTDNLAGLCHHHHHLVHEGNWMITGNPEETLTFTNPYQRRWCSPPRVF
ncbi:MAG: DUF222 domain-containing protein [Actinobacteria bacterium]|nr:DUF222 domain-containing protein [Actinomycetota bacterium]